MAKLFVKADGTVEGIYSDDVDYADIGAVDIRRASEVEWDHETQSWGVRFRDGNNLVLGFRRRGDALAFEVQVIEAGLRGKDVTPYIIQEAACRA